MNGNRIIYALKCPLTGDIHYIGKSEQGIFRPKQHLSDTHSEKVKEWIDELSLIGQKPDIEILEYVPSNINIDTREKYHIFTTLEKGGLLLNSNLIKPILITSKYDLELNSDSCIGIQDISKFIKEKRRSVGLTQEDFADKCGLALTVIRKLEQGKTNVKLESLIQVLKMFGTKLDLTRL